MTNDFVMIFSDETGEKHNDETFVDELQAVARHHGYDISQWGTPEQIYMAKGHALATRALEDALEGMRNG